jgi:hypothetical protein
MDCALQPPRVSCGTYDFSGVGEASWFELASAIVEMAVDRWESRRDRTDPHKRISDACDPSHGHQARLHRHRSRFVRGEAAAVASGA